MPGMYWLTLDFTYRKNSDRMSIQPESVMTVQEVAGYLRVNQRTVYRLAVGRKLPGFKVGATWRFKRADIDGWIAAQSLTGGEGGGGGGDEGEDKTK